MLVGNVISILSSGVITIAVTLVTDAVRRTTSSDDDVMTTGQYAHSSNDVWEKTRDIDNPLRPWSELFTKWAITISVFGRAFDRQYYWLIPQ